VGGSVERLDEKKIDLLRRWGEGLGDDPREELRAAGRAIQLLIEEIEQLHVDLWSARSPAAPEPEPEPVVEEQDLPASLRARLGLFGRRRGEEHGASPP
jgi:hypothetical protein